MTLRVGVIGLGVGEQHVVGYEAHPQAEVVAICDRDEQKLAEVGERYPRARRLTDAVELLAEPELDVVSIASYDSDHHEQVVATLGAGRHVFVEKPLCTSAAELAEIESLLAERPQLRLSSNLPLRRSPRFLEVRELIRSGGLGRLFYLEADYEYGRLWKLTEGWRGDLERYSVMLGGGVHMIDLLLWWTGERVLEVSAIGNRIATEGSKYSHDDLVLASLRLQSGAIAKVSANFGCVHPHYHAVKVFGTEGTFINGLERGIVYRGDSKQMSSESIEAAYPGVAKSVLVAPFVDSIVAGSEPEIGAEAVIETMTVCLAIDRALAEGGTVAVAKQARGPR